MLVLSRSSGEALIIGDALKVTVRGLDPPRVRLELARVSGVGAVVEEVLEDRFLEVDQGLELMEGVRCVVVRVEVNKARLGVIAPKEVPITRLEIYNRPRAGGT